ncbi:ATP-dependent DNA helicase DinG [Aquincola sp. S2]|uniref:ATP-dependent DNA helicase DinG n=1 Tax=Pseudaquabacterium terrae TaxID=2732868 RepID=A0ABX2ETR4_9BURK|nr:ATP-dependent DNA helicase DinG [Aquabacterium terrae]NRF72046.1 ATP-dependent DNA helicase DinG [Aquabacterium terrae]
MLTRQESSDLARFTDAVRRALPNFRESDSQHHMMSAIAETFDRCLHGREVAETDGANILVCESGTGTGKTFAYAMPGLVLARSVGKKLVISTSTVALQEQLCAKDLPFLQSCAPWPFSFAIAKGRVRYACRTRLEAAALEARQIRLDEVDPHDDPKHAAALRGLVEMLDAGRWTGDRDQIEQAMPDALWARLTTDRSGCTGSICPHFGDCPFQRARQRAREADVIVANHDLVLSALDLNPGSVLPDPADCFFVFDEGHTLPAKTVLHHAERHPVRAAYGWIGEVPRLVTTIVHALHIDASLHCRMQGACADVTQALGVLWRWIEQAEGWNGDVLRFRHGVVPGDLARAGESLLGAMRVVLDLVSDLRVDALKSAALKPELVQHLLGELGAHEAQAERVVDVWTLMLRNDRPGAAPTARWIERSADDAIVAATPIDAGDRVQRAVWRRVSAAIVTSATLTAGGEFGHFLRRTGLDRLPDVRMLRLGSPFDYRRQARIVVPHMRTTPADAAAHTDELAALLPGLVAGGASLVLFASAQQMHDVVARLSAAERPQVLMQGELSKAALIQRHRQRVDEGRASTIFGLAAFHEGVDLPGRYCTQVVIVRLPFAVPTHPWEQARAEWVRRCGRSPFRELVVPEAAMRLAQAVGRLIRTSTDRGTVTILDRRLVTRRYGRELLRSLPPMLLQVDGDADPRSALAVDEAA